MSSVIAFLADFLNSAQHFERMKARHLSLIFFIFCATFFVFGISKVSATTGVQNLIYVDCTSGIDQAGCGEIGLPCESVTYAAQYLDGGLDVAHPDTMYIKGTCSIVGSTSYNAPTVYPRGNYCKFTTWPGQPRAFLDGGASPTGTVLGKTYVRSNNITVDNLKINGEVSFRYSDNLLLTNIEFFGGGTTDYTNLGQWNDVLFIEDCMNGMVLNSEFHDANGASAYGSMVTYYGKSNSDTTPANFTFRNNSFYVTPGFAKPSLGIFLKQNSRMVNVDHNFFYNLWGGVFTSNQVPNGDVENINNNIFSSCGNSSTEHGAITLMANQLDVNIYNNTFVNSVWADIGNKWNQVTFGSWNNLFYGTTPFYIMIYNNSSMNSLAYYLNYNDYYDPSATPSWYDEANFTTFSSWQSHIIGLLKANVTEVDSLYADPGFINASGLFNTPSDFKRSSYPSNGRGGIYPSAMGAYITGNEIIGYTDLETPLIIRSDVDNSSATNTTDALLTLRNSLGLSMNGTAWINSATTGDVNCDEVSNSTDALLILRYSLGLSMNGTSWCE